jgi:oligoendopeptidase F
MVRAKYPTVTAFQADLGNILQKLGFDAAQAEYLSSKITVDAARGSGHAAEPGRRDDKAHLRTRFGANGMDYKGYNIAIHEFGHNVEQTFSLNRVPHVLLRGVPNSAFTEAFAFVFQDQDLRLLGLTDTNPDAEYLTDLDVFWQMYEIAGVALVDMRMWHWLYDHPNADAPQLRDAVVAIAKDIWNRYYAPVFGVKDIDLLAIYSHMIDYPLYLPDYPLGQVIAFQIERYLQGKNLGQEMERMCAQGSISPGLWMERAVGAPISTKPMLDAADAALKALAK